MVIVVGAITASSTVRNIATPSLLDTRVLGDQDGAMARNKGEADGAPRAGRRKTLYGDQSRDVVEDRRRADW